MFGTNSKHPGHRPGTAQTCTRKLAQKTQASSEACATASPPKRKKRLKERFPVGVHVWVQKYPQPLSQAKAPEVAAVAIASLRWTVLQTVPLDPVGKPSGHGKVRALFARWFSSQTLLPEKEG